MQSFQLTIQAFLTVYGFVSIANNSPPKIFNNLYICNNYL